MTLVKMALLVALAGVSCSCSWFGKSPADPSRQAAEMSRKEAVTIEVKADAQLNRFDKKPHTLYLCIYQLKDPNGFNQLAEEKGGLTKLLECSRFDGSVASAKQLVVQPGQELREVRDRAEGARYVGIATGYYGTGKEKLTDSFPLLPVHRGDTSSSVIRIDLGPRQITRITVK